ncbi:MAG: DUF6443 domain-containing protein [Hyphomicrobiales bacterium]
MKKIYLMISLLFQVAIGFSQVTTNVGEVVLIEDPNYDNKENYRIERVFKEPLSTYTNKHLDPEVCREKIIYFDGLGRLKQTTQIMAGSNKEDIIIVNPYKDLDRIDEFVYLPVTNKSRGKCIQNPEEVVKEFYSDTPPKGVEASDYPFARKVYDDSPLNRIIEQSAPGESWQTGKHTIRNRYRANKKNEVYQLKVDQDGFLLRVEGYYPPNSLNVKEVIDENGRCTIFFINSKGNVLLERKIPYGGSIDTYYVYNELAQLQTVVPPELSYSLYLNKEITKENQDAYCFRYKYDQFSRIIEKKQPGREKEYMIYDNLDQLVLYQDGNLRSKGQWKFNKYDIYSRLIQTGVTNALSNFSNSYIINYCKSLNIVEKYDSRENEYTNVNFPELLKQGFIETESYYDTYDFTKGVSGFSDRPESTHGFSISHHLLKGQKTGEKVLLLEKNEYLYTKFFYDKYSRLVQTVKQIPRLASNGSKAMLINSLDLNYAGEILQEVLSCTIDDSYYYSRYYDYDHEGRVTYTWEKYGNGSKELISRNRYNSLGQSIGLDLGRYAIIDHFRPVGKSSNIEIGDINHSIKLPTRHEYAQCIDYSYNIRGWLTGINNPDKLNADLFGMKLNYDKEVNGSDICFNGNISSIEWKHKSKEGRQFYYSYDRLNRLEKASISVVNGERKKIDSRFEYDYNGNIVTLFRFNNLNINKPLVKDFLVYKYKGNQLINVSDNGRTSSSDAKFEFVEKAIGEDVEYNYDKNGNCIADANKGINDIQYNSLNLPSTVKFDNNATINFEYDANGVKFKKSTRQGRRGDVKEYYGNFVFSNSNLDYIKTPEGRLVFSGKENYEREYHIKDHLGNIRSTFTHKGSKVTALSRYDYHPFGLLHEGSQISDNAYLYNGKELQQDLNLQWYDYGTRMYNAALGRWHCVDPMAEKYSSYSPYNYVVNNPIIFVDPDGEEIWIHYKNKDGKAAKMQYTAGMKYEGGNDFATSTVKFLNAMNSVEAGAKVLSSLSSSKNSFDFTNTPSAAGNKSFQLSYKGNDRYTNGGAQIYAAAFLNSDIKDVQKAESAAHEMYHGYQRENGQNPATVNGEVGAYLFGRGVAASSKYGSSIISGFSNQSSAGQTYEMSMLNLIYKWDANPQNAYNSAIKNFSKGSRVNNNGKGIYKNHKIDPKYKPLIFKFLPLVK